MKAPPLLAISIETVARCTRRCWFCMYGLKRYQALVHDDALPENLRAEMPWESIEAIIADLARMDYSNRVSWYRINEPLLDSRMPEILRKTRAALPDCWQTLITNGDLLDEARCGELFDAGLDELTVSAYDADTLARVSDFSNRWNIVLKDRREPSFATNRAGNIPKLAARRHEGDCARPSTMMNVHVNGDVSICCCDLFGDHVVGNVLRDGIAAVWEGEGFTRYRSALATGSRTGLSPCDQCDYAGYGHKVRHTDPAIAPDSFAAESSPCPSSTMTRPSPTACCCGR